MHDIYLHWWTFFFVGFGVRHETWRIVSVFFFAKLFEKKIICHGRFEFFFHFLIKRKRMRKIKVVDDGKLLDLIKTKNLSKSKIFVRIIIVKLIQLDHFEMKICKIVSKAHQMFFFVLFRFSVCRSTIAVSIVKWAWNKAHRFIANKYSVYHTNLDLWKTVIQCQPGCVNLLKFLLNWIT